MDVKNNNNNNAGTMTVVLRIFMFWRTNKREVTWLVLKYIFYDVKDREQLDNYCKTLIIRVTLFSRGLHPGLIHEISFLGFAIPSSINFI